MYVKCQYIFMKLYSIIKWWESQYVTVARNIVYVQWASNQFSVSCMLIMSKAYGSQYRACSLWARHTVLSIVHAHYEQGIPFSVSCMLIMSKAYRSQYRACSLWARHTVLSIVHAHYEKGMQFSVPCILIMSTVSSSQYRARSIRFGSRSIVTQCMREGYFLHGIRSDEENFSLPVIYKSVMLIFLTNFGNRFTIKENAHGIYYWEGVDDIFCKITLNFLSL